MRLIEETAEALANKETWFPPEIDSDPWVVYHGTSSVFEKEIEQNGFKCGSNHLDEGVLLCLSIIITTEWFEDDATASLRAYSLPRIGSDAPFYCALFPQRSALFTRRMFSGGETSYILRRVIPKLVKATFDNPNFFEERLEKDLKKCIEKAKKGHFTQEKVLKVNLVWLKEKITELKKFLPDLLDNYKKHSHGIIYALKINEDDVNIIQYQGNNGLAVYKKLSYERCVGKLIIHGEHDLSAHTNPSWDDINFWREECDFVKLSRISGFRGVNQRKISELQLTDPEGAEDMRFSVMIKHGNELLRKFAAEQKEVQHKILMNSRLNNS